MLFAEPDPDAPDLRLGLPAAAAWVTAWQGRLVPPFLLVVLAVACALAAALVLLRSTTSRAMVVAATLVCVAAGGLAVGARVHSRTHGPLAVAAKQSSAVVVEGVLTGDPRVVAPKTAQLSFQTVIVATLKVQRLEVAGREVHLRQPVLVISSDRRWIGLLPSQRVRVEGRLQAPDPGDDVAALLSARGPPVVLSDPSVLQRFAGRLRAGLQQAAATLPAEEHGLLPGLVEGDTSGLDSRLLEDFRRTGLTHLVAVSGDIVSVKGYCQGHENRRLRPSQPRQPRDRPICVRAGGRVPGLVGA